MSEVVEKVRDAIDAVYEVDCHLEVMNMDAVARAAIEALFEWMAEPSEKAIDEGGFICFADGNRIRWNAYNKRAKYETCDWANEVYQAFLAQLKKEALG